MLTPVSEFVVCGIVGTASATDYCPYLVYTANDLTVFSSYSKLGTRD